MYKCKRKRTPTYVYGHWMGGRISTIMDERSKGIMDDGMNGINGINNANNQWRKLWELMKGSIGTSRGSM